MISFNIKVFLALMLTQGCGHLRSPTPIWLHQRIDPKLCTPEILKFGIYRVVSCENNPEALPCKNGKEKYDEFISYCNTYINDYISADAKDPRLQL